MSPKIELAQRFFGEVAFKQILNYLDKDPIENLPRIFDLILKVPLKAETRKNVQSLKEAWARNPVVQQIVARIIHFSDKNVQQRLVMNVWMYGCLAGPARQQQLTAELGYGIPGSILIDPTSICNLHCDGCWAGAYSTHNSLSFEIVDRIVTEAKDLGIHFIAMSGGEPLLWPPLLDLCRKHQDVAFMMYTNGTIIDEYMAEAMRAAGNMSPAISLEGEREPTDARRGKGIFDTVMAAMDHLKGKGVPFGASLTITRDNASEILSDAFIDMLIDKGVLYIWTFHYIPIGRNPDFSLRVTPEQRAELVEQVRTIRQTKPVMIVDFWNDGAISGGCIAGGRRYFHIAADGAVEPCAFVHYSTDNIKNKSLKEVLRSPLFHAFQKRQPFNENMLRPCPIIDNPQILRDIIAESGAKPTHKEAEAILCGEQANELDKTANVWARQVEAFEMRTVI
ncbi:MAG: radical SAM protein [bacterium]|nr:radical SAM protein [bacterium]